MLLILAPAVQTPTVMAAPDGDEPMEDATADDDMAQDMVVLVDLSNNLNLLLNKLVSVESLFCRSTKLY